jgi:hypothetical protein
MGNLLGLTRRNDAGEIITLEYEFLQEFEESDGEELQHNVDRYFDTPPIKFVLNEDDARRTRSDPSARRPQRYAQFQVVEVSQYV